MKDINKLAIPLAVVISSIVLGVFFYAVQINKQDSIEKQQDLEMQYKKEQDNINFVRLQEQEKAEHVQDRRSECLKIYQTESDKWNNTTGYEYVPEDDICYISYTSKKGEWDDVDCDDIGKDWDYELFGFDSHFTRDMFRRGANCSNEQFEKQF